MKRGINWLIFGIVGLVIVIVVLLVDIFLIPWGIHYQIGQTLALVNGTDAWERWVSPPVPIYFKMYMFSVQNPDEVANGAKPRVKEIGPYVYREFREKVVLEVDDEKDTASYYQIITYKFDEELSKPLKDTDVVTIVNPVLVGAMEVLEAMPTVNVMENIMEYGLPPVLGGYTTALINTTVREFIFDGMQIFCNQTSPSGASRLVCSAFNYLMPMKLIWPENGNFKFALFGWKNATKDGPYVVKRGLKVIDDLGKIISWKGVSQTGVWSGEMCNTVKGSDMALMPPFIDEGSDIYLFSSDVCSSPRLVYEGECVYKDVSGLRFVLAPEFLGGVQDYPESYCYCPTSSLGITKPNGCLKKGALDLSGCLDVPGIVSLPHLMDASPDYQKMVDGLKPDPAKHSTFIELEPTTGTPLRGYQKIQINILTKPTPSMSPLKFMPVSLFPLCWYEEGFDLPDGVLQILRDQLLKVLNIVKIVKWVLIACGLVMAIVGGVMAAIRLLKDKK